MAATWHVNCSKWWRSCRISPACKICTCRAVVRSRWTITIALAQVQCICKRALKEHNDWVPALLSSVVRLRVYFFALPHACSHSSHRTYCGYLRLETSGHVVRACDVSSDNDSWLNTVKILYGIKPVS